MPWELNKRIQPRLSINSFGAKYNEAIKYPLVAVARLSIVLKKPGNTKDHIKCKAPQWSVVLKQLHAEIFSAVILWTVSYRLTGEQRVGSMVWNVRPVIIVDDWK